MYCNECGFENPDNSKFCSNCGKKQGVTEPTEKEIIAEKIIENEIVRQVVAEHKKSLDYVFLRKAMGWYLAWVVLHLGLLLIGSDGIFESNNMGAKRFWPFGRLSDFDEVDYYDITEFLVYTIFPLAILFIISMVRNNNNEQKE
jgi:hypothetical protein